MTRAQLIEKVNEYGMDARFVGNVIVNHHSRAWRKLQGLLVLLEAGKSVRTGQFDIDVLVIDGARYGWEILESPRLVEEWSRFAERS